MHDGPTWEDISLLRLSGSGLPADTPLIINSTGSSLLIRFITKEGSSSKSGWAASYTIHPSQSKRFSSSYSCGVCYSFDLAFNRSVFCSWRKQVIAAARVRQESLLPGKALQLKDKLFVRLRANVVSLLSAASHVDGFVGNVFLPRFGWIYQHQHYQSWMDHLPAGCLKDRPKFR